MLNVNAVARRAGALALATALLSGTLGPAAPVEAHEPLSDRRVQIEIDAGEETPPDSPPQASLPDLEAVELKVLNAPGSTDKLYCVLIRNVGSKDAGPFVTMFSIDGIGAPERRAEAGHLEAGASGELCAQFGLPGYGEFLIGAHVDAYGAVHESDPNNNYASRRVSRSLSDDVTAPPRAGNAPVNDPAPPPPVQQDPGAKQAQPTRQAQPDLTIGAIEIKGRVPDGNDDCKDGRNAATVVVKNGGAAKADGFVVRLSADGASVDVSVPGLDAGQEREVRFEDVRLKQGKRTLTALADAKGAVAETNEDNNDRKVTAQCTDD
jgi:hypothetical protein